MVFLIPGVLVILLYLLSLRGRRAHPGMSELKKWKYAHRGIHGKGLPENSMGAFRAALEGGYGIELDLHLTRDGNLAVIHDSPLLRTTGKSGRIEDLTTPDLKDYRLQGSAETIPTFRQVLELYNGKAPLIIELKPVDGNHAQLAEAACRMLEGYSGSYCMESFDPRCLMWLRTNRPEILRGQLSENYLSNPGSRPSPLTFLLANCMSNFLTRPDFIAYRFKDRHSLSVWLCRNLWGITGVSWTLRSREEYGAAVSEGWIPIFESFRP